MTTNNRMELKAAVASLRKSYVAKLTVTRATAEAGTEYYDITSAFTGYFHSDDKKKFSFETPLADLADNGVTATTLDALVVTRGNCGFNVSVVDGSRSSIEVQ